MHIPAKKSLGQNFLHSQKAITTMVGSAGLASGDVVVEIGPGKGALTVELLKTGARVYALELDLRMIEYLSERFSAELSSGQLVIHHGDILEMNIVDILGEQEYVVVANIPYYITNAIIRFFLSAIHQPRMMCLLMQREVAERIVARHAKESLLSLSVKAYGVARYVMKVPRTAFRPAPKVDSAIITIHDISRNNFVSSHHEKMFFEIIKQAFAQKRKQLVNNISLIPKTELIQALLAHGYPQEARAEDIRFDFWIKLAGQKP